MALAIPAPRSYGGAVAHQGTAVRPVGRDAELAAAAAAVAAVAGGDSEVVVVSGEAGIGKSALLAQLRESADDAGLLVLEGRAAEHERDVPFGVVMDAFDDHVAGLHPRRLESLGDDRLNDLAAVLPGVARHVGAAPGQGGPAERFRHHRALRALIELLAGERPVAVIFDDVHWADEGSLETVLHLLRRPPRAPHLIALAMRPVDPAPRVLDAVRAVESPRLMTLGALPREAALELLGDVDDDRLRERLEHEAGGNPLYLHELARAARERSDALPPTLMAAVERQVASLPPASRALLDGAAVVGDPFDPELAAAAADLDPDDALAPLDRLAGLDLVQGIPGDRRFRFRHPIVRRAVYLAAPDGWRVAAHERAAAALEARGASTVVRAYHVEQSAKPGDDRAIAALADAAHASVNASPGTAARWYAAALRLIEGDEPQRRADLLAPMALALASAGRMNEAHAALVEVLDLLPAELTPSRVQLTTACAEIENVLGRHRQSVVRLERLLAELPQDRTSEERASVELQLALGAAWTLDVDGVARWGGRVVGSAEGVDAGLEAAGLASVALASYWRLEPDAGRPQIARAERAYEALQDSELARRLDAGWALGAAQVYAERWEASAKTLERGLRVARSTSQDRLFIPLSGWHAMALCNAMRVDAARPLIEAAEEAARLANLEFQLVWALWLFVRVLDAQGESLDAHRLADEVRARAATLEPNLTTRSALVNVAFVHRGEDPERTLREMTAAGGEKLELLDPIWVTYPMLVAAEAAVAAGRVDDAELWADRLAGHRAAAAGLAGARVRSLTARALVLLARDEATGAVAAATGAAEHARAAHLGLDEFEAGLVYGRALAAAGRREEATTVLQEAAALAVRGGARKMVEAAGRDLRRVGSRLAAATSRAGAARAGMGGLTDREREIASLVAEGKSNKQVAAAVFLSEKTVEHHLSRIFAKVGVRSRVELTRVISGG